jgi:hypothetical protein
MEVTEPCDGAHSITDNCFFRRLEKLKRRHGISEKLLISERREWLCQCFRVKPMHPTERSHQEQRNEICQKQTILDRLEYVHEECVDVTAKDKCIHSKCPECEDSD